MDVHEPSKGCGGTIPSWEVLPAQGWSSFLNQGGSEVTSHPQPCHRTSPWQDHPQDHPQLLENITQVAAVLGSPADAVVLHQLFKQLLFIQEFKGFYSVGIKWKSGFDVDSQQNFY